jgi:hypothetical protein
LRNHDYTYPNGMKAPRSVIEFIEAEARGELLPPPAGTHAQIAGQSAETRDDGPRQVLFNG